MAKKMNKGLMTAEVGAAMLAAAAGAGYYFYGAKGAKKHRQAASKWAKGMKAEVIKEAKKARKLDQRAMAMIIDRASKTYRSAKNIKREDVVLAAAELKRNWKQIAAELRTAAKQGGRAVKKAAKTATRGTKKKGIKRKVKKAAKKSAKKRASKKVTKRG